ncbi:ABC transporter permease [Lyngbya confervoides]|uniref:ABC transporter permease n=1 Tax=Lyngbya confervoides BDU141951 TaxID=1574623 RepID=A0ABD4T2P6_9CYAN|nr:ABC transporter permease [Lyngbya confervoides]MCM1982661.1 ABC transporter permease [Lyngbya confervoides BDU141951]
MTSSSLPSVRVFKFWQRSSLSLRLTFIGLVITLFYIAIACLAPLFAQWGWLQDPQNASLRLDNPLSTPPSWEHWFGTDDEGYDVLSRTVFGTQVALQVVVIATLFSLLIGVPLGMLSGYFGGPTDRVLLFVMDTTYTLPGLLLAIAIAYILKGQTLSGLSLIISDPGILNAAIALSVAYIPQYYRVVRNHTVSVKTEVFIEAAQALGASPWRVLTRYLFGNVVQSVPVLFTLNAADAILTLAGLGFLGLGLPQEVPEWGFDLSEALKELPTGIWWTAFFPGMAMTLMVVGLSLLGEGLNEFVNPLLKKGELPDN